MAEAGADVLVPHMGLTTKGTIGAQTAKTLDQCVEEIQAMRDAAVAENPDVIVLCHGGPLAEPDDAHYVLERTEGIVGFFGASSMERLPDRDRDDREHAPLQGARRQELRRDALQADRPRLAADHGLRLGRDQAAGRRRVRDTSA